jgi:hypothetical protein
MRRSGKGQGRMHPPVRPVRFSVRERGQNRTYRMAGNLDAVTAVGSAEISTLELPDRWYGIVAAYRIKVEAMLQEPEGRACVKN